MNTVSSKPQKSLQTRLNELDAKFLAFRKNAKEFTSEGRRKFLTDFKRQLVALSDELKKSKGTQRELEAKKDKLQELFRRSRLERETLYGRSQ